MSLIANMPIGGVSPNIVTLGENNRVLTAALSSGTGTTYNVL